MSLFFCIFDVSAKKAIVYAECTVCPRFIFLLIWGYPALWSKLNTYVLPKRRKVKYTSSLVCPRRGIWKEIMMTIHTVEIMMPISAILQTVFVVWNFSHRYMLLYLWNTSFEIYNSYCQSLPWPTRSPRLPAHCPSRLSGFSPLRSRKRIWHSQGVYLLTRFIIKREKIGIFFIQVCEVLVEMARNPI